MTQAPSDLTGRQISLDHTYHVEELVHRGPMTALYAAVWHPVQCPVILRSYEALVRLGLPIGSTRRIVGTVRSELSFLPGPGLPDVVDLGEENQFAPFHVLRLPPGGLLLESLQTGQRLEPERTARLVRTIAHALDHLRSHDLVHRGPTPDRVWVGDDGSFTLLGAGEVLYRDDTVRMKSPPVSELIWHIPPESFIGSNPAFADDPTLDTVTGQLTSATRLKPAGSLQGHERENHPRAEVYALGCLAYAALNGFHPFFVDPADPSAGVLATLQEAPLPLRTLPEDSQVAATIFQAFARNPDDRFETPVAFADALDKALSRDQPETTSTTPSPHGDTAADPGPDGSTPGPPEAELPDQAAPHTHAAPASPTPGPVPLGVLRAWQAATLTILLLLVGYIAWERFQPVSIIITSDPPSIELTERVGHTHEYRGRTPIVLRHRSPLTPIELQVVGPDGDHGPPASFTPVESRAFQDLGRCYRLPLQLNFEE
ncbi:MAG: hypothetical protein EA398_01100 [Deltaproteobacteria bacterium]|nr:MAG: hypothetical protein EA398_01100 [Deltaproteobacteria bacterium]